MFIPFITSHASSSKKRSLERRKGGGGKGGGGGGGKGGGGGSEGGGSGSSGGSGGGARSSVPVSGSAARSGSATTYGAGGGRAITIPSGQLFAGRPAGGGTRNEVFGNQRYGSGYPGARNNGVGGLGFPFFFWPVVWGGGLGVGGAHYLNTNHEYGDERNTSRPGGPMFAAAFVGASPNTTFHVLADNATAAALVGTVNANCSSLLASSSAPAAYNSSAPGAPQPEEAVQYFRASSIVLTLDGYNNSAALSDDNTTANTPLPSGINTQLLDCLNQTIGLSAPLIDSGAGQWGPQSSSLGILGLFWILWTVCGNVLFRVQYHS